MGIDILLGVVAALIAAWLVVIALLWLARPRGVPLRTVLRVVPDALRMLRGIITDGSAPLDVRLVLIGLVAWMLSPIDLIPEFVPVIGPLDDAVVLVLALRYVRRRLGADALRARWPGTPEGFDVLLAITGRDRR